MLLSTARDNFILSLEANGLAERTVGTYRQRLGGFLDFAEAQEISKLEDVTPELVDAWAVALRRQRELWKDHQFRGPEKGELSNATIAGRIQSVKFFFRWCVERGCVDRSPARHLKQPRLRRSARTKVMRLEDLDLLMEEAEHRSKAGRPRDLALICFLVETGCRLGEIATLTISSLNLEDKEAAVKGKTTVSEDSVEFVDFGDRTVEALRSWLAARPAVAHDYVFLNLGSQAERYGRPLKRNGIYQILKRLAKAAGVTGRFNPHSIRHLVGQRFTDRTNLELARQKLRHKNIQTTANFYAHQDRERVKQATENHSPLRRDE